jgi:hypothetical protein
LSEGAGAQEGRRPALGWKKARKKKEKNESKVYKARPLRWQYWTYIRCCFPYPPQELRAASSVEAAEAEEAPLFRP